MIDKIQDNFSIKKIEKMRGELIELAHEKGVLSTEVLELSQHLDKCILEVQQQKFKEFRSKI